MKKKKIKEISIEGEGKQIKRFIEDKYTYGELAKKFQLYETTIKQYLKNKVINNQKFINRLEAVFQRKYNEIVVSVESQVNHYIISIKNNIRRYNKIEDEKIFYRVYCLSIKYSDPYHQLVARGNLGKFKFNIGFEYEATEIISEVITESVKRDFTDLAIYYNVHLASMYLSNDIKYSMKILENAKNFMDNKTSNQNLYIYHYLYGIILNRLGKSKEARNCFEKALRYTEDEIEETYCLTNIGLTYYSEKKYKTALMWSQRALDKTQVNQEIRSAVLNNIANIYLNKGEVGRAAWYLEKAMENFQKDVDIHRKISIYHTYLEINGKEGTGLIDDLINLLSGSFAMVGRHQYLVSSVKKLFIYLVDKGELEYIKKLLLQLIEFCESVGNQRDLKDLKEIIVDIMIYTKGKGGMKYEEIC